MHQLGHFFAIAHLRKNMAEMHKKSQKDFKLVESGRKCRKWLESRLGLKTIFYISSSSCILFLEWLVVGTKPLIGVTQVQVIFECICG